VTALERVVKERQVQLQLYATRVGPLTCLALVIPGGGPVVAEGFSLKALLKKAEAWAKGYLEATT
jgi:hypothetical protein